MYRSFSIKRFRCFRDFKLEPLERINLIAGMNNVGKTALLEALFLHIGQNNPHLSLVIDSLRGAERHALINAREMWGWLFFDKQIDKTILAWTSLFHSR